MAGDDIARLVLTRYAELGRRGKPVMRSNGIMEGTVLAGVVAVTGGVAECVALATGVKALPTNKFNDGRVLHDCHAEILALRAFNRWLVETENCKPSEIYLYISAAPCGDASMTLTRSSGGGSWSAPSPNTPWLRGRSNWDVEGAIRTKPGRTDSPLTMSKSCTDKLALRQVTGILQSCVSSHFGGMQLFLTALVLPTSQYVATDFERAFSRWNSLHRFAVLTTSLSFEDSVDLRRPPSPISLIWLPGHTEAVANGIRQGNAASCISRSKMAQLVDVRGVCQYYEFKSGVQKPYPQGWPRTPRDDFPLHSS